MAASRTKRKLNAEQQVAASTLEVAADIASQYIKEWAQQEARKLLKTQPLIVPASWGYQVGRFKVSRLRSGQWSVQNEYNELINNFTSRRSAILYSVLYQIGRFAASKEILQCDQTVGKLEADMAHYAHSIKRATERNDYVTVDVVSARYYDTQHKLSQARNDLEKSLNQAKYVKVWEKHK